MSQLEDPPKNPEVSRLLQSIAQHIGGACPPGFGFALVIMQFGTTNCFYVSSVERKSVVDGLKQMILHLDEGQGIPS